MERRPFKTNYAGAIYGTILSMAVISTASKSDAGPILIACWATATAVVFWLAHAYSTFVAAGLVETQAPGRAILDALRHDWPMVQGAVIPAALMLLAPLGLVSEDAAGYIAVGTGVLVLFAAGLYMGYLQRLTRWRMLLIASTNAVIGLMIVGLKAFVH